MTNAKGYRLILDQYRDALEEYGAAIEGLLELVEARGMAEDLLPLIVAETDDEMFAAIRREANAEAAVASARRQLGNLRLTQRPK